MKDWNGEGPLPMLYSRTATGAINTWQCWVENEYVCVSWGQLDGAVQYARFACVPKNEGRSNATSAHEQAIKEAKAKWTKQIKKKYSTSLETAGETVRIKPMLALDIKKRSSKKPIEYPVYVQPKLDGVRCLAYRSQDAGGRVVLQSRGGDFYDVEHIRSELEQCLQPGFILDGELYIHGMSLQKITSLVRRPQPGSEELWYCVYDMSDEEHTMGEFPHRHRFIRCFFDSWSGLLSKVVETPTQLVDSESIRDEIIRHHELNDYEGGIVRTRAGLYKEDHRSPELLKVKRWKTDEYVVVGCSSGKGKFEDVPIFRLITKDGKEFDAVPKGDQEERKQMLSNAQSNIGKLMTVKYFQLTDDGIPQFPVALGIRYQEDL